MKYNFIIPYRNRKEHLNEFMKRFTEYLKDKDVDVQFYIIHQINTGEFNRGAMKNIGFLEVCKTRPDGLFIFHDVDTYPTYWGSIQYEARPNEIRHPVGEKNHNLGTICCFWKLEFEKINGFPNYWSWGYEDNAINNRVNKAGLTVDRSQFYPILDKNILQLKDGITRIVNRGEFDRYVDESKYNTVLDGVNTISNIVYTFDENTSFLNVTSFQTPVPEKPELNKVYDIRNGNVPFLRNAQQRRRGTMGMMF
jgi:hypothetical protein